jgi:hypothetical protein
MLAKIVMFLRKLYQCQLKTEMLELLISWNWVDILHIFENEKHFN